MRKVILCQECREEKEFQDIPPNWHCPAPCNRKFYGYGNEQAMRDKIYEKNIVNTNNNASNDLKVIEDEKIKPKPVPYIESKKTQKKYILKKGVNVLGRADDCDICLNDYTFSMRISNYHCRIIVEPKGEDSWSCYISDDIFNGISNKGELKFYPKRQRPSTNGTYILCKEGEIKKINEKIEISNGHTFFIAEIKEKGQNSYVEQFTINFKQFEKDSVILDTEGHYNYN